MKFFRGKSGKVFMVVLVVLVGLGVVASSLGPLVLT